MTFSLHADGTATAIPNSRTTPASLTVYMYTFQLFTTLAMLFNVTFLYLHPHVGFNIE
jgi:hypothetical protein